MSKRETDDEWQERIDSQVIQAVCILGAICFISIVSFGIMMIVF